jgi:thiamine biosynthesis lipoprotein
MIITKILKITVAILFGFLLLSCQQKPELTESHDSILAFGTFVEVTLVNLSPEDRQVVIKQIEKELGYYHFAFHPWKSGPTGRTNQLLAATGEFTSNPSLIPLLQKSKMLEKQSKGLFNPAIGQLVKLWGYHDESPPENGPIPSDAAIQAILDQKPSLQGITIHGVRVTNTNPVNKLDFGGIAKGYAIDLILKHIQEMGVKDAIISTGGDLKVIGKHGNKAWHIGIRDPRSDGVIASLDLQDNEAAFTSGDYERFYKLEGKRYHHILDPRTGQPARNSQSVTVIHNDAALADAAATALFVAGPEQWLEIAASMGIQQAMLIDRDGKIHITEALAKRVTFEKPGLDISTVSLQ